MSIKSLFKKNWLVIVSFGLSLLFSFLLGRRSVRSSNRGTGSAGDELTDIREQLAAERTTVGQLVGELESERNRIEQLEGEHSAAINELGQLRERADRLEIELAEAERILRLAEQYHADTGSDIEGVRRFTGGLRDLIERHRGELEKIKVTQSSPDRGGDS